VTDRLLLSVGVFQQPAKAAARRRRNHAAVGAGYYRVLRVARTLAEDLRRAA